MMTMKKDSALVLVRDALETYGDDYMHGIPKRHYLAVIDHALADEPKLVGLTIEDSGPEQQRTWVGLTDEEISNFVKAVWPREATAEDYIRAIEAKLKEKNT